MERKIYKVKAEYFIEAESAEKAEEIVKNEDDFFEAHVLITPATLAEIKSIEEEMEQIYNSDDPSAFDVVTAEY